MKKIFLLFALAITVFTATAQKWSVDSFTVNSSRIATVYLSSDNGQSMVKNIRAFVNPTYNQQGQLFGGSLDNRGGLMLAPPIRPSLWETDGNGNKVAVGFGYNTGSGSDLVSSYALVYIIEGYVQPNGSITFSGREERVEFSSTFNPADWIRRYSVGSYEIPNFCLPVQVTKHYASARYFAK